MDVQEWLATTADRAPPLPSDDHRMPDGVWADPHEQDRERRKHTSSDSSLIVPRNARPANRSRVQAATRSLLSEQARSADSADSRPQAAQSSIFAPDGGKHAAQKTYERRPRHKTRPDRYEPKGRKRKGTPETRKGRRSGKKRRKSHRNADGGRTIGLIQSFQLRKGPKNSRLTIKPGATAGLYKHGRASAQVTGRADGLPDLVFNEMRFLQRPAEHQDAIVDIEQRPRNRKERRRLEGSEIAAYFNAQQSARGKEEEEEPEHVHGQKSAGDHHLPRQAPARLRRSTPPAELPSRRFLGLGSSGVLADSKRAHSEDTSLLPWSQTQPSQLYQAFRAQHTATTLDTCKFRPRKDTPSSNHRHHISGNQAIRVGQNGRARSSLVISRHEKRPVSRREEEGKVIERHCPSSRRAGVDRRPTTKPTSQSLPRVLAQQSHNVQHRPMEVLDEGYRTSDILDVHDEQGRMERPRDDDQSASLSPRPGNEVQNPKSSFSIDRLLEEVRHVTSADMTRTLRLSPAQKSSARNNNGEPHATEPMMRDYRVTVRGQTAEPDKAPLNGLDGPPRRGPRVFPLHQSPAAIKMIRRIGGDPRYPTVHHPLADVGAVAVPPLHHFAWQDDETLDDGERIPLWQAEPVYASAQQAEHLVHGSRSSAASSVLERQSERVGLEGTSLMLQIERTASDRLFAKSVAVGRPWASEQMDGTVGGTVEHGMDEFWKPNRLY